MMKNLMEDFGQIEDFGCLILSILLGGLLGWLMATILNSIFKL